MILMNSDECGHTLAFFKLAADHEPGPFGGDHDDIDGCRRDNLAEMNIEPMREHEALVLLKMGENLVFEDSSPGARREEGSGQCQLP